MGKSYIGITLGPIFDTICDASSPAALWFASNLFSDLTKRICAAISMDESAVIYSPYYAEEEGEWDGVGKYHDRIIFSTEQYSAEKLKDIIRKCKKDTVELLPNTVNKEEAVAFFETYLQIHYVVKSENELGNANCILELSPYLDALELMKTFPKDDKSNPLGQLFAGAEENRNKYIKESPLYNRVNEANHQMKNNHKNRIWTIEEIASHKNAITEPLKRKHYYAVVSADGDNMGKFLQKITNDQVTKFSELCLQYDTTAAGLVGAYGGMTIYAGGDDLLFLAPVMTAEKNVFALCQEIQQSFNEIVRSCEDFQKDDIPVPTISFGISIQYAKYPLYEALEYARELLAEAKSGQKNAMCIGVQKHSGQSIRITVPNSKYEEILKELITIEKNKDTNEEDELIHSVLYILGMFSESIKVLDKKVIEDNLNYERYQHAWGNFFDNAGQQKAKTYIEKICKLYYDKILKANYKDSLETLIYLLRLKHFLVEKEGEREVSGEN